MSEKKTYHVYGIISASKYLGTVEAASDEEAKALGEELSDTPTLCHQCAREIELGDMYEIQVENHDG